MGAILGKKRGRRRRKWLEIGPQGEDLVLFIERCDFLFVSLSIEFLDLRLLTVMRSLKLKRTLKSSYLTNRYADQYFDHY